MTLKTTDQLTDETDEVAAIAMEPTTKAKKKRKRGKKTSEVPTRIFSFRGLGPITEADRVENQFRLAAQYRNVLVEIQHWLKGQFREIWLADETVAPALRAYEEANGAVDAAYDDLRAAKAGTADPDLAEPLDRLDAAKELRAMAGAELSDARDQATALLRALERADPIVGPLRTRYDEARTARKEAKGASAAEKARLDDLKQVAHDAWEEARKEAEAEGRLPRDAFRLAREEAETRARAARTDYRGRGVRQGVYTRIEDSVKQAAKSTRRPLHFESYDKSGAIGEQLTERKGKHKKGEEPRAPTFGLTVRELVSQVDTRLRLGPPGATDKHPRAEVTACATWDDAWRLPRNVRRHAARTWIDLRVGTNTDRTPIFARFPITLHRPLPKDAVIKWAYVVRRRVGYRLEWRFQLSLESSTFDRPPIAIGQGACAINLGWRRMIDDQGEAIGLRAAYVVAPEGGAREIVARIRDLNLGVSVVGHSATEFEIQVPDYVAPKRTGRKPSPKQTFSVLGAIGKEDDLASIRDQNLERIQLTLSVWLADRGGVPSEWEVAEPAREDGSIPKTMSDRLRGYSAWRAAWKLRRFIDAWKVRRVPGDDQIFDALTAWAKQDRHLEIWLASMRDKRIARRSEAWKVIAAQLARAFATIVVGKSKLTEIDGWEQPAPEDGDPSDGRLQRRMSRIAAPGELLAEIIKAASKTGAEVRRREEVLATQECAGCGCAEPWDAAPSIMHQCVQCRETWDQDANHCRNLLAREGLTSGGGPRTDGPMRDHRSGPTSQGKSGSAATSMHAQPTK